MKTRLLFIVMMSLSAIGEVAAQPISEWYSYLSFMHEAFYLQTTSNHMTFLAHDTLARFVTTEDSVVFNRVDLAAGLVLDPKDDVIDLSSNPHWKLNKSIPYMVDSIAFRYAYCRYIDSVPAGSGARKAAIDTLIVFVYKSPNISRHTIPREKWAGIAWDSIRRCPKDPNAIDTILLTAADTTARPDSSENSWAVRVLMHGLRQPINLNKIGGAQTDNLAGFVLVFKPGITYDTSYTLVHQGSSARPPLSKRLNYFGLYSMAAADSPAYQNISYYNTSLYARPKDAYPGTSGRPGLSSGRTFANPLYLDGYFKVTTWTNPWCEINESDAKHPINTLSPNPAKSSTRLRFTLEKCTKVSVSIYSPMGQLLKEATNAEFNAGLHETEIDLKGLKAGLYFVNITAGGLSETRRLTITD